MMTKNDEGKQVPAFMHKWLQTILLVLMVAGPSGSFGEKGEVADDFNRSITGPVSSADTPNPIGSQYAIADGAWEIVGRGVLQASSPGVLYDTRLKISHALGHGFVLKVNVFHPAYTKSQSSRQAGIIINYQDPDNYYLIRWGNQTDGDSGNIQIVKRHNGKNQQIGQRVTGLRLSEDWYEWKFVSSPDEADTVTYSVSKPGSSVPVHEGSFTDSLFSSGYAGFYRTGSGTVRFDDYSLTVESDSSKIADAVPPPPPSGSSIRPENVFSGMPRSEAALAAMKKASEFMSSISTHGGYLWNYSIDLKERAGENIAPPSIIWFSDINGTPLVGQAYVRAWEVTRDPCFLDAAREVVGALAHCQLESGGWHYSGSFDPSVAENRDGAPDFKGVRALQADPGKPLYPLYVVATTFDDDATQLCTRFLINHVAATRELNDPRDDLARQTLERALAGMLRAQYPNGAWPQRYNGKPRNPEDYPVQAAQITDDWPREWPADRPDEYTGFYTLNDRVMRDCISTMLLAGEKLGRRDCHDAAKRGGDFLILAQFPEPQPGWAQQYDYNMRPAWARSHEVPGVTSQESRTALEALLELYLATGEEKYLKPIPPAIAWLQRSQLSPDMWSRYYELGSNQPIYGTKDGRIVHDRLDSPASNPLNAYGIPEFVAKYEYIKGVGREAWNADPQMGARAEWTEVERRVDQVIGELDTEGRWLSKGALARKTPVLDRMISTKVFYKNMTRLSNYLDAVRASSPVTEVSLQSPVL